MCASSHPVSCAVLQLSVLVLQAVTTGLALLWNHVDPLALFAFCFCCFVLVIFFICINEGFVHFPVLRTLLLLFSFLRYSVIFSWPFLAEVCIVQFLRDA